MPSAKAQILTASVVLYSLMGALAAPVIFQNDATISATETGYDGTDIIVTNCTVTIDGQHSFASVAVLNGGVLTHSSGMAAGLNLIVTNNVHILPGGMIDVDDAGFAGGTGPGAGASAAIEMTTYGGGAGHAGYGGSSHPTTALGGIPYGIHLPATNLGSGGGGTFMSGSLGGSGGGAVRLWIGGELTLQGVISANGGDGTAAASGGGGGGSGGSVWITAQTASGAGVIAARGGAGVIPGGGGGSGGRVVLAFTTNSFTGTSSTIGGDGSVPGAAGSVLLDAPGSGDTFIVDNGGRIGTNTAFNWTPSISLKVMGGARLNLPQSTLFSNLFIGSNSVIFSRVLTSADSVLIGNVTIESGGIYDAAGAGLAANQGTGRGIATGAGTNSIGSGAGHGGHGASVAGLAGGVAYGSFVQSLGLGSGGGVAAPLGTPVGAQGGGAVRWNVTGTAIIDGTISVNGRPPSPEFGGGGGSAGSIWITAGHFTGSGVLTANGGDGSTGPVLGGGGAGGRIIIDAHTNTFTGAIQARGGGGAAVGGAGTIYLTKPTLPRTNSLIVDNGGKLGATTPEGQSVPPSGSVRMIVRNGGRFAPQITPSFESVLIGSNAFFLPPLGTVAMTFGNVDIEAGGGIVGDASGDNALARGTFVVVNGTNYGSGGGHGGQGGASANALAAPSLAPLIDPIASPANNGGGGGGAGGISSNALGGSVIRLTVPGRLRVDGRISADGGNAFFPGSGGGAGGSIFLTVAQLSGSGRISANGGNGFLPNGGGGGGGRVAVHYTAPQTNAFNGEIVAAGGNGAMAGGAGTVYLSNPSEGIPPRLIVDNLDRSGTNTPLPLANAADIVVRGGAQVVDFPNSVLSLLIRSNSSAAGSLTVSGDLTLEHGAILKSRSSSSPGVGSGATFALGGTNFGGGGGYGGSGGWGAHSLARGGNGSGSAANPILQGALGGGNLGPGGVLLGGLAGGVTEISVNGTLQVDGWIASDGSKGVDPAGGGGSGGSVNIRTARLAGSGRITADGGNGASLGGGGGGGRIAIRTSTNDFAGSYSARGGIGFRNGGAGSILFAERDGTNRRLLLDNKGIAGTNSPVGNEGLELLTVRNGAIAAPSQQSLGARNIVVKSNAWLGSWIQGATYDVAENLLIEAGGGVVADGGGSPGSSGIGFGRFAGNSPKGGGTHGGYGGDESSPAGQPYGSVSAPLSNGSGGGNGSGSTASAPFGGSGGGIIRLRVGNELSIQGIVSANGFPGETNSGGGSGGSIWIETTTISGAGTISADGGSGNGTAGGGGGGRVALIFATNTFTGNISTRGGGATTRPGGAGTIYLRNSSGMETVLVNNDGLIGENTPFRAGLRWPTNEHDVVIQNGAGVVAESTLPLARNVTIGTNSLLTTALETLEVAAIGKLDVQKGGRILARFGHPGGSGPGAGSALELSGQLQGSGAGHGGVGGASASGAPGGTSYGSAQQPALRGSGGGSGSGQFPGGAGGGAMRVTAGSLNIDGRLDAGGWSALQANAGGGSGGSIWITSSELTGNGVLTAVGGNGLAGGGGGAGGRIALYVRTNSFSGDFVLNGGTGFQAGGSGSLAMSNHFPAFHAISMTPTGTVAQMVSFVDVEFNGVPAPASLTHSNLVVIGPNGALSSALVQISTPALSTVRLAFPIFAAGQYHVNVGTGVETVFGEPLAQPFSGSFTVVLPAISGTVTRQNGLPLQGAAVYRDNEHATTTAADGTYSVAVPGGWSGLIRAVVPAHDMTPESRWYDNVVADAAAQDFVAVAVQPQLTGVIDGARILVTWEGLPGRAYELQTSTNLLDWTLYSPIGWSNTVVELPLQDAAHPGQYFRVQVTQ